MPDIGTLLLAGRIGWGIAIVGVLGIHAPLIINPPAIQTQVQIATQGQQITDLERRMQNIEQAKTSESLAAIQSQLSIDHQILFVMAGSLLTLSGEALWRVSRKKEK